MKTQDKPEYQFVDVIARLLELPPAERVLSLRTRDGRAIQLVLDSMRPLTLRLDGTWTPREEAAARILILAEASSRPDLARLLDADDAAKGVVFSSENQYSASALIHALAVGALRVDPAKLTVERDYEDHDARPEIAAVLDEEGAAEILHEKSGVRVRVTVYSGGGYSLRVPTATLDPARGQVHRAREAISDAGWRLNDGDLGSEPDLEGKVDDPKTAWGYSADRGDAKAAADAALRLLCKIAAAPIDVRVRIFTAAGEAY